MNPYFKKEKERNKSEHLIKPFLIDKLASVAYRVLWTSNSWQAALMKLIVQDFSLK